MDQEGQEGKVAWCCERDTESTSTDRVARVEEDSLSGQRVAKLSAWKTASSSTRLMRQGIMSSGQWPEAVRGPHMSPTSPLRHL